MNTKWKVIIGLCVTLAVVSVGGLFALQYFEQRAETTAILVVENGLVSYKLSEQDPYTILASEEISLPSGSYIKTDTDSYARVFFPDNSLVSIDASSEIQINYAPNSINVEQLIGQSWHRVQTVTNGGKYQVTTPNTIAAVRGTIFSVKYDGKDTSTVEVTDSNVDVSSKVEDTAGVRNIETQQIPAGDWAEVVGDREPRFTRRQIAAETLQTFWYKRNKLLDEQYGQIKGKFAGRAIREQLKGRLQSLPEFKDYRLGFRDIDRDGAKEELQDVFDLLRINENTCQNYSPVKIQVALLKVRRYARFISKADKLERIITNLGNSCADGRFSVDEAEQLENLIQEFNN